MHPLHEQYSRNPPTNALSDLFGLLDHLDHGLREEVLLRASEIVDPFIDPQLLGDQPIYLVFREAAYRLCNHYPEDVVVRHIVNHTLWLLLHYGDPLLRRHIRARKEKDTRQLALFVTAPTPREMSPTHYADPIYDQFCDQVVRHLVGHTTSHFRPTDEESLAFLALCEMKGVGYWTLRKLVKNGQLQYLVNTGSRDEFYRSLRSAGAKSLDDSESDKESWRERLLDKGRRLSERLMTLGISFLPQSSARYPEHLRNIDDPPPWLFVQGNIAALEQRSVAIVGTRTPSPDGMRLASMIGEWLPQFESAIVSGLAEGIDQTMHVNSINRQIPTIAVLGTGILSNFPSGSESIREQICVEGGAVTTEYLPRDSYSAKNFVRRNRIQAGLASVVIPVEWREKSGTAHTVRFAYEAKRRIVCARLPHWQDAQHGELLAARKMGAFIFTLPDEQREFVAAVQEQKGAE